MKETKEKRMTNKWNTYYSKLDFFTIKDIMETIVETWMGSEDNSFIMYQCIFPDCDVFSWNFQR